MKTFLLIAMLFGAQHGLAQTPGPEVRSWIINTDSSRGYNNIPSNVQLVQYTDTDVYVSCTCIPGYDIGPWAGNPNTPANQDFCFKITRSPKENTGTKTATGLGHIGVWINGVSIFNAKDAFSYKNQKIWNQDALPNEGASFDECLGHPAPNGEYHHHVNPVCLYDDKDSARHSPLIGFSFDGFPVYGAYGYRNPDGTGGITRMRTGYRLRSITERNSLPDGTQLQPTQHGPAVSGQYPLGKYIEDYEYVEGLGDLDKHNGRFCKTPEYPDGIYAYFVTVDEQLRPVFPYTVGPDYYGMVQPGNTGPQSGHNSSTGTTFTRDTVSSIEESGQGHETGIYPNPSSGRIYLAKSSGMRPERVDILNLTGEKTGVEWDTEQQSADISALPAGVYFIRATDTGGRVYIWRILKQ